MTTTSSEATPTHHDFDRRAEEVKVSKMDINSVIMDYLINEGYPAAAKKFAVEANIKIRGEEDSNAYIDERVEIRNAIYVGEIQTAIEKINDLNPELLDTHPSLHFSLLRLHLINLIQSCAQPTTISGNKSAALSDITPALQFAQTHLATRAAHSPAFLSDLERTMALLIYPPDALAPPIAELLEPRLRRDVAQQVNEALLVGLQWRPEARLRGLVRLRAWAEERRREKGINDGRIGVFVEEDGVEGEGGTTGNGGTSNRDEGDGAEDGEAMQT